eukprot:2268283-Amphidinium_carterae.1
MSSGLNHQRPGYKAVSRWEAGAVFYHPVMMQASYAMELDADAYFPGPLATDPMLEMQRSGAVFAAPSQMGGIPLARQNTLWEVSLLYARLRREPMKREYLQRHIASDSLSFLGRNFLTDFSIAQTAFFRDKTRYGDWFAFLESIGGWWSHAFYSTMVTTIGVGLWASSSEVMFLETPYAHQASCVCGDAGTCVLLEGVAEGMSQWYSRTFAPDTSAKWVCWTEAQVAAFRARFGTCRFVTEIGLSDPTAFVCTLVPVDGLVPKVFFTKHSNEHLHV